MGVESRGVARRLGGMGAEELGGRDAARGSDRPGMGGRGLRAPMVGMVGVREGVSEGVREGVREGGVSSWLTGVGMGDGCWCSEELSLMRFTCKANTHQTLTLIALTFLGSEKPEGGSIVPPP